MRTVIPNRESSYEIEVRDISPFQSLIGILYQDKKYIIIKRYEYISGEEYAFSCYYLCDLEDILSGTEFIKFENYTNTLERLLARDDYQIFSFDSKEELASWFGSK